MDHPNIIKLYYEHFEDQKSIYLIMELCIGDELFDKTIEAGNFTEVQAAITVRQMVPAMFYVQGKRSVPQ